MRPVANRMMLRAVRLLDNHWVRRHGTVDLWYPVVWQITLPRELVMENTMILKAVFDNSGLCFSDHGIEFDRIHLDNYRSNRQMWEHYSVIAASAWTPDTLI